MKTAIEKGKLLKDVPLHVYTTWRIGGRAERLYCPLSLQDLIDFLKQKRLAEQLTWLGLGSNVLIKDGGIAGTTILTKNALNDISLLDKDIIRAEAGITCAKFAQFATKQDLVGGEFLSGIPGTIGGALAMNAGAFGHEIWEFVKSVEVIDSQGNIFHKKPNDFDIGYRSVKGLAKDEWFAAGLFKFENGEALRAFDRIRKLFAKRAKAQPQGACCGSVFQNPEGKYAGQLIESCNLKNYHVGDVYVSKKHANFIMNRGNAKAADAQKLIQIIKDKVKAAHDVELKTEVKVLGEEA